MNIMKLKEFNTDKVVYIFIPENKGDSGEVAYYFATKESRIEKQPAGDENMRYTSHAKYAIEQLVQNKAFPMEYINAWG